MKALFSNTKSYGPFNSIIEENDRWVCDNKNILKVAIGDATVSDVNDDWIPANVEEHYKNNYNLNQEKNRQSAYEKEADPLFFQVQRGDIENQVWLDKVAEIKARYPYKV